MALDLYISDSAKGAAWSGNPDPLLQVSIAADKLESMRLRKELPQQAKCPTDGVSVGQITARK